MLSHIERGQPSLLVIVMETYTNLPITPQQSSSNLLGYLQGTKGGSSNVSIILQPEPSADNDSCPV